MDENGRKWLKVGHVLRKLGEEAHLKQGLIGKIHSKVWWMKVDESGRMWKKVVKSGSCSPAAWRGGPPIDAKVRLGAGRSSNEQKLDL